MRTSCVTLTARWIKTQRRTWNSARQLVEAASPSIHGVYRRFLMRRPSTFFLRQFPITALCPHHMSFTSNYRKLRVSLNARIQAHTGRSCFQVPEQGIAKGTEKRRWWRAENRVAEESQNAQHLRVRQRPGTLEEIKEVMLRTLCKQNTFANQGFLVNNFNLNVQCVLFY